jgi:zinc protease
VGDVASLSSISLSDLRAYHGRQFVTSRMLLVVVGDVARPRLEGLVRATLARLPAGSYAWTPPREPLPSAGAADVVFVQRRLPTNYILGYFGGPPATSPDYQALRVATAILSGRLFEEIRSRRNLTYAVHAPFVDRAVAAGGLYVTTVQPDTTLALMRTEIEQLKQRVIVPEALERIVQQFITEYFLDNETNADQADFLARAYLFRGDYRAADAFVDELRGVRPDDIVRVARQYMRNVRFAYVGDTTRLSRARVRQF